MTVETRWSQVSLIFLTALPFALVDALHYATLPVCLLANVVYLTIDMCAASHAIPNAIPLPLPTVRWPRIAEAWVAHWH